MYSPISPRKAAFGSCKSSPRKPILSPSEFTPFSFSSEAVNLCDNEQLQQNNGIIQMSLSFPRPGSTNTTHLGAHSQPRTPTSGMAPILPHNIHSAPSRSLSLGGTTNFVGAGSTGRSIRDYDEKIRDLQKENFNLKLRIYFQEERAGSSRQSSSKDELVDLKIQCETLKYELNEKTELLTEAATAVENLQSQLITLNSEREEERHRLEERVKQLEDDFEEPQAISLINDKSLGINIPSHQNPYLLGSPGHSPAKTPRRSRVSVLPDDEDENLLQEVDEEMKRGVEYSSPPLKDHACQTSPMAIQSCPGIVGLGVLEERDESMASRLEELEQQVEQLNLVLHDTEICLEDRFKEVQELNEILKRKDETLEALQGEKIAKAEEAVNAQNEVASLSSKLVNQDTEFSRRAAKYESSLKELQFQLEDVRNVKNDFENQIRKLRDILQERDKVIAALTEELIQNSQLLKSFEGKLSEKQAILASDRQDLKVQVAYDSDYQVFSSPRPQPFKLAGDRPSRGSFQIVTQTLHIPPTRVPEENCDFEESGREVLRLKKDIKKLREYLKTSVQERKFLVKKISTLNDRLADTNLRRSLSPSSRASIERLDVGTQSEPMLDKPFEVVAQKLSNANYSADILRKRLESVAPRLESSPMSSDYALIFEDMMQLNSSVVENILDVQTILSLVDDIGDYDNESRNSSSSLSNQCLPDPSGVIIMDDQVQRRLNLVQEMENQISEKNKVIQDQHKALQDYRLEFQRLQDSNRRQSDRPKRKYRRQLDGLQRLEFSQKIISEEEDTWSEPDVSASRRRMGLSQHALAIIEKAGHVFGQGDPDDSTDLDKSQREKLKSFYSLDYTGQDFSDKASDKGECRDYVKIIEELQSHRKEIERLHIDLASCAQSAQRMKEADDLSPECDVGSLRCLINGLNELARTMDNLAYQIDLSDTVDSGNISGDDVDDNLDFEDSEEEILALNSKDFDEFHVELCHGCTKSLPLELENCLHRCGALLAGSAFSLQRLRHACCKLRNKLRRRNNQLSDKGLLLSQLEESVLPLREKAELADRLTKDLNLAKDDLSKRNNELQEVHSKLNDNYKLVANLSAENLKLSGEKLKMEKLVDEVRQEESLLRLQLNKAQTLVEAMNSSSPRLPLRRPNTVLNRPKNLPIGASESVDPSTRTVPPITTRSSSSETSSSFDFVPNAVVTLQHSPSSNCQVMPTSGDIHQRRCMACFVDAIPINQPPPAFGTFETRSPGQERRGKFNSLPRGARGRPGILLPPQVRQQSRPDYGSDRPRERDRDCSRGRRSSLEKVRPQSTSGIASEISSPDLGVDLACSDPFSSLERGNGFSTFNRGQQDEISSLHEENRILKLKLSETHGALKDLVERQAASTRQFKKDQWLTNNPRPGSRSHHPNLPVAVGHQETLYSRSPSKQGSKNSTPTHRPGSNNLR